MSIDLILNRALLDAITSVLRMKSFRFEIAECFSECHVPELLVAWLLYGIFAWVVQNNLNGNLKVWMASRRNINHYKPVSQTPKVDKAIPTGQQKTFSYPDTLEFNFFDPDNLPEMLQPYSETVFNSVQMLAKQYGFQVDNSRNQAEHLLMLLTNESNPSDANLSSAAARLHSKIFANYRRWCDRMGSPPLFCKLSHGKAYAAYIEDMLMFLLIWGAAANLKHLPECLCFIYHKSMQEHIINNSRGASPSTYPGFFLDMVVTPIYDVIATSLKSHGDHDQKKIYDDFNEFFWSPSCMRYRIHEVADDAVEFGLSYNTATPFQEGHVARGLQSASKTYLEKRSWLHPLLSMHRVIEWHTVTFTVLVAWAFSNQLVWNWAFTIQTMSFVFWEITLLSIIWTCLEVWTMFPNTVISGPSVCGFLIRLLAGYLALVYQTVYYHWSYRTDVNLPGGGKVSGTDCNFWWWQYIWLSLAASSIYFIESFLCWVPHIVSALMTWNNDVVQAMLNICYPTSQLYVGKKIDVPMREVVQYILYWLTLISFKLWFGYRYIVNPVTIPTLELYDDYMNFQNVSFYKTGCLVFLWWFPHFLVYLIDLSIWYSCWSSIIGGYVALVQRQGAVRDSKSFREHFMRSPLAFCEKIMPSNTNIKKTRQLTGGFISSASISGLVAIAKAPVVSSPKQQGHKSAIGNNTLASKSHKKNMSSADLQSMSHQNVMNDNDNWNELSSEVVVNGNGNGNLQTESVVNYLDVRSQRWVIFGRVWNEIINRLRINDLLSDTEKENFMFSTFDWLSKPVYLPLFQTAGCVESAMYALNEAAVEYREENELPKKLIVLETFHKTVDVTAREAVSELWELIGYLFGKLLGSVHQSDINVLITTLGMWAGSDDIFIRLDVSGVTKLVNIIGNIVGTLKGCMAKRKKTPVITPDVIHRSNEVSKSGDSRNNLAALSSDGTTETTGGGNKKIKKSISTGFLAGLDSDNNAATTSSEVNSSSSSTTTT